jgi:hypothetical protein
MTAFTNPFVQHRSRRILAEAGEAVVGRARRGCTWLSQEFVEIEFAPAGPAIWRISDGFPDE